ncbi:ABC transporter permease [Carboxydochorda subterranea]|uniref:ABC transporter permease n=1 Tax=Carboxydichorda subterranea TaxID=3109565 RepID=A0ABZ1BXX3_9FIRM|nr:ABC transporter permease [Limnochorda sp. L945t]WRP17549.1 ABC transporter permease [Limnochorda sp. L945t]
MAVSGSVRRAFRSQRFMASLVLVLAVLAFALAGPAIAGRDPNAIVGMPFEPPSGSALLGTDNFGKDELTLLMYGTRTSLEIGAIAGIIAVVIGTVVGTTAGYYGGVTEELLMGVTNVLITIPSFIVLILLSIALQSRSVPVMGLIIGITSWPWTARAVRAQASSLRAREHVDVARLSGSGGVEIIVREIIPYMLSYLAMAFTLQLASAVLTEAALSMLGLGPSNTISLGVLLQWALLWEAVRQGVWWTFVPPVFFLAVIAFSLQLLNASLDEIYNPRLRREGRGA